MPPYLADVGFNFNLFQFYKSAIMTLHVVVIS